MKKKKLMKAVGQHGAKLQDTLPKSVEFPPLDTLGQWMILKGSVGREFGRGFVPGYVAKGSGVPSLNILDWESILQSSFISSCMQSRLWGQSPLDMLPKALESSPLGRESRLRGTFGCHYRGKASPPLQIHCRKQWDPHCQIH